VLAAIRRLAQDPHTGGPDTDDRPFAKQEMRPAVRLRLATESRRQALDRIWQGKLPPPLRATYPRNQPPPRPLTGRSALSSAGLGVAVDHQTLRASRP